MPFGFQLDGDGISLVEDDGEQHAVGVMVDLRAQGWSYRRIVEELEMREITAKCGGRWNAKVVMDICRRGAA